MENKSLPRYYTILFNAVTDAIQALDRQDFGQARALLVQGRRRGCLHAEAEAGQAPKGDVEITPVLKGDEETTPVLRGGTDVIPA